MSGSPYRTSLPMKQLKDMTLEELRVVVATIDDIEVRESAYELLRKAEQLEKQVADRIVQLIGQKYDTSPTDR